MRDKDNSREQLIEELRVLRGRVAELEKRAAECDESKRVHGSIPQASSIIKAFDGFMYLCSRDYRVEFMNERLIQRTGYDGTGGLCYKVLHKRDSICPWCVNERVFSGETVRWEVKSPKDDKWFYVVNTPAYHEDGTISKQSMILDISDRKRVEEALQRSEERYRELVENVNSIVLRMDNLGNATFLNEFGRRFFGYKIIGKNVVGTIFPEVETTGLNFKWLIEDIGRNPDLYVTSINENIRSNGERAWIAWTKRSIRDKSGRVKEILCIGNDITERKRAEEALQREHDNLERMVKERTFDLMVKNQELTEEIKERRRTEEALRESEEKYRSVVDHIGIGVALISPNMEIVTLNNQMKEWFPAVDVSKKPICYKAFNDPPLESICSYCPTHKTLQDGQVHESVTETPAGDEIRNFRIVATPIKDETGKIIAAIEMVEDITESKRMQERLLESEIKYRTIFETTPCATLIVEEDTTISLVNSEFERLTGCSNEKMESKKSWTKFVVGDDLLRMNEYHRMRRIDPTAAPRNYEFRTIGVKGHTKHLFATVAMLPGTKRSIISLLDVTDRKRTEDLTRMRLSLLEYAASHSLDELLQKTLDEVGALTSSPIGFYHFVESDQNTLSLQTWSRRTMKEFCQAEGKKMHCPIEQAGVWADCVRKRRPVIHNDYSALPHRKGMPKGHAVVIRELVVPIMRSDRIVAILGIGNKPEIYTEHDVEIVSYLADVVWEIAERKRAEEALRKSEKELRFLSSKLLVVQEEERKRIARELHDGLGGTLSAIKISLENARKSLELGEAISDVLDIPIAWTLELINDTRRLMLELRPSILDNIGVIATVKWFLKQYRTTYPGIHVQEEIHIEEREIPEQLKTVIFRMTQEAFHNIAKHSGATVISLFLLRNDSAIELAIEDNGNGFDLDAALSESSDRKGLGLTSMKERAELSGGSFQIHSISSKGTAIRASWPIERPAPVLGFSIP